MKFWTRLPGLSRWPPDRFTGREPYWEARLGTADFQLLARRCDELGCDALTVPEHLVMPVELAPSMGAHWPDALTVMSFVAGATTRIRVNSGVIALPLHHPVRLAKAVATLDQISGGRVMLTFGGGMAPGEFAALGVDFRQRGPIADEYVAALKTLWAGGPAEFHGEFIDFSDVLLAPVREQRPTHRSSSADAPWRPCAAPRDSATAGRRPARRVAAAPGSPGPPTCPRSLPRLGESRASPSERTASKSRCGPSPRSSTRTTG